MISWLKREENRLIEAGVSFGLATAASTSAIETNGAPIAWQITSHRLHTLGALRNEAERSSDSGAAAAVNDDDDGGGGGGGVCLLSMKKRLTEVWVKKWVRKWYASVYLPYRHCTGAGSGLMGESGHTLKVVWRKRPLTKRILLSPGYLPSSVFCRAKWSFSEQTTVPPQSACVRVHCTLHC